MAGNRLGKKALYQYLDDNGNSYSILRDTDLAAAAGLVATDPATPLPDLPKGLRPRYVLVQSTAAVNGVVARKRLICNAVNEAYASEGRTAIQIDGEGFISTGRVGEKKTFR